MLTFILISISRLWIQTHGYQLVNAFIDIHKSFMDINKSYCLHIHTFNEIKMIREYQENLMGISD